MTVSYTGAINSIYEVVQRPITIQAGDVEVDSDATYHDILSKIRYYITSGSIAGNDELNINLSISLQSGLTLNEENFETNFAVVKGSPLEINVKNKPKIKISRLLTLLSLLILILI